MNGQLEIATVSHYISFAARISFQVLVNAGASKSIADANGKFPVDIVCRYTFPKCSETTRASLIKLLKIDTPSI